MSKKDRFIGLLRKVKDSHIEDLIKYIETKTDFFEAPASTRFHGSYKGGLVEHSLNVYDRLNENIYSSKVHLNVPERTIILTSLLHDLCKANFYKTELRWRKDDNNKWEQYPTYGVDDELPFGHGEKSVYIINKFITLSTYEAMMIRWHMGFSESREVYMTLNKAIERYPLILAIMNADMEATYILEGDEK